MNRVARRGKIPSQDWPSIVARYEAGETMTHITQTYDCSPPAISYVITRSRAHAAPAAGSAEGGIAAAEGAAGHGAALGLAMSDNAGATLRRGRGRSGESELRRGPRPNGGQMPEEPMASETAKTAAMFAPRAAAGQPGARLATEQEAEPGRANDVGGMTNGPRPEFGQAAAPFIDAELRERIYGDICAFLVAFDAALAYDSIANRAELRAATDRVLRVGARTRIELERLEARAPLAAAGGTLRK